MLTNLEMYEEIRHLWHSMSKRDLYHEDLYLYFERPQKGKGYHGGGEFYIYVVSQRYFLSYSERGEEYIIVASEDFADLKFEIALIMSDTIVFNMIKESKRKNKNEKEQQSRIDLQLKLLNNVDDVIYQKAVENYNKYGALKIW